VKPEERRMKFAKFLDILEKKRKEPWSILHPTSEWKFSI